MEKGGGATPYGRFLGVAQPPIWPEPPPIGIGEGSATPRAKPPNPFFFFSFALWGWPYHPRHPRGWYDHPKQASLGWLKAFGGGFDHPYFLFGGGRTTSMARPLSWLEPLPSIFFFLKKKLMLLFF
jgi:hypothetical protein